MRECEEEEIRDERMVCRPDPLLLPFHFCPRGTKEMKARLYTIPSIPETDVEISLGWIVRNRVHIL